MLLGMNLSSNHLNYNIQRKQNDSFTIFANCKNNAMLLKNPVSVLEMWNFQETRSILSCDYDSYA